MEIGSIVIGASASGLEDLFKKIHTECIEEGKTKLDDTSKVFDALDQCWLGEDREKFKNNFTEFKDKVKDALDSYDEAIRREFQSVYDQWVDFQQNNVK